MYAQQTDYEHVMNNNPLTVRQAVTTVGIECFPIQSH